MIKVINIKITKKIFMYILYIIKKMNKLGNNYTDERFTKLSEKIAKLQNLEVKSPSRIIDIETRIDNLQIESIRNLKDLEFKMKYLEEELLYITKMIEDSIVSKNTLRNRISNEIKETENKIKSLFEAERQAILDSNMEMIRKLESEYARIQEEKNKELLNINAYVQNLKEVIDSDVNKLKADNSLLKEERMHKFSLIVNSMKDEFKYLNDIV